MKNILNLFQGIAAWLASPKVVKWIVLSIAIFISIFLVIAAWGKFFHPVENLQALDHWVSLFEVLLICLLLAFRMKAAMWLLASLIFASWTGFSLFWFCLELPCHCMGSMVEMTSGCTVGLDVLFFILSLCVAYLLGASRSLIFAILLGSLLFVLIGFVLAEYLFFKKMLRMPWSLLYTR